MEEIIESYALSGDNQVFTSDEFGEVRTVTKDGEVWFCGKDVCTALGYGNTAAAIDKHCGLKGITFRDTLTKGGNQKLLYITEGNLYRLVAKSKMPSAQKFESWVFDEVLPTIRKHGAYMTGDTIQKALESPDFLIQLATKLKEEKEKRVVLEAENKALEQKIEADRPKTVFADAVSVSKTSILVSDLAKILKQNGVDIGQNRLFSWLRDKGWLCKQKGAMYNTPTQKAMDKGLFEVKETVITHADGHTTINKTPKVTGNGQVFFVNLFLGGNA